MTRRNVILAGIFLLLLAGIVAFVLFRSTNTSKSPDDSNFFGSTTTSDVTSRVSDAISLSLADGTSVVVSNFIPENQPEWWSEGQSYVISGSGSLDGPGYEIVFSDSSSSFGILILDEPIGERRKIAEQVLREKLQLSDSKLCLLKTSVFVLAETNPAYANRDIGLSFCPGSVPLP